MIDASNDMNVTRKRHVLLDCMKRTPPCLTRTLMDIPPENWINILHVLNTHTVLLLLSLFKKITGRGAQEIHEVWLRLKMVMTKQLT